MTEQEWLEASELIPLVRAAQTLSSSRKVRLFVCACARCFFPPNAHPDLRHGVGMAEEMADGTASRAVIETAREIFGSLTYVSDYATRGFVGENEWPAAFVHDAVNPRIASMTRGALCRLSDYDAERGFERTLTGLPWLRDIFGNPFRPLDFTPWRTDTAVTLARQMYDARDFSLMPILADAIQDAGCENEEVLNHCRDDAQLHYRG